MLPDAMVVLIAEDNSDDAFLLQRALHRSVQNVKFHIAVDGSEVIRYLRGEGKFSDRTAFPFPRFMLLDLKMPLVSGFDVLEWLRNHPDCRVVPTIVMSASKLDIDVKRAYQLGANAYFVKPVQIAELLEVLEVNLSFWRKAELPVMPHSCG